ncbi:hypothetical protein EDB87DRAFT_1618940 [Lactarius vividus]|nr:hypothetical protein EDB87DRAFT_1618940 [Lactarius vividus]
MEDQWTILRTDPQCHHVVPHTAARPNFQPNTPTPAHGINATIPNCSCQTCSDAQRSQPTLHFDVSHRVPIPRRSDHIFFSKNAVVPYMNQGQGFNNHVENVSIAPVHSREPGQFVPPQAAEIQDNGYPPVPEREGPFDIGLIPAPILNASIAEGRRRLAVHYINNPDAYVSMIRLEPGQFGRFQVIIVLEMANIL